MSLSRSLAVTPSDVRGPAAGPGRPLAAEASAG